MFSNKSITQSTGTCSDNIKRLLAEIANADAILIGAGAGLSTAAGLTYSGERFERHFADFRRKYDITDMYSGGFYPYATLAEYWAWWSRHIYVNRYDVAAGLPYAELLAIVKDKDYFVLTTNVDHQFQLAGFDKKRLFYTQGDYGLWQCSQACHNKTYDNESAVRQMLAEQQDMRIPTALIPKCPVCGAPMTMNLRCDSSFVEDAGWHAAAARYHDFIHRLIIKYPFWQMTAANPNAVYACINLDEAYCPKDIAAQSICLRVIPYRPPTHRNPNFS